MRVILSPEAEQDIKDIASYVSAKSSKTMARKVVNRIKAQIRQLSRFPGIGHEREDLPKHIHSIAAYDYMILHSIEHDMVAILRVVHGARNIGPNMIP